MNKIEREHNVSGAGVLECTVINGVERSVTH